MSVPMQRPGTLWTHKDAPRSVEGYFSSHQGEFSFGRMKSLYPYNGSAWNKFRELLEINPYEGYHRFEGKGEGCWELVHDKIRNGRTADLLAAAELLSGETKRSGTSGPPRGIGIDQGEVWVGLLDGGVGVEVQVGQDEETNRAEGWQRTTIRGPLAFRCLLEVLGFDWINRKLPGEEVRPSHKEISNLVDDILIRRAPYFLRSNPDKPPLSTSRC
jgi:hypothetical protein